jgi:hypothetical protein
VPWDSAKSDRLFLHESIVEFILDDKVVEYEGWIDELKKHGDEPQMIDGSVPAQQSSDSSALRHRRSLHVHPFILHTLGVISLISGTRLVAINVSTMPTYK